MRGKFISWEKLQEQDPKQTAIVVSYTCPSGKLKNSLKVIIGGYQSREEAWEKCKKENIKTRVVYEEGEAVQISVKLLRLSKVIRQLADEQPDNAYAIMAV